MNKFKQFFDEYGIIIIAAAICAAFAFWIFWMSFSQTPAWR